MALGTVALLATGTTNEKQDGSDTYSAANIHTSGTDCFADKVQTRKCKTCSFYNSDTACSCVNGPVSTNANAYMGTRGTTTTTNTSTTYDCYHANASGGYWVTNLVNIDTGATSCRTNTSTSTSTTTNACVWSPPLP